VDIADFALCIGDLFEIQGGAGVQEGRRESHRAFAGAGGKNDG
jgi:hypothetical protein